MRRVTVLAVWCAGYFLILPQATIICPITIAGTAPPELLIPTVIPLRPAVMPVAEVADLIVQAVVPQVAADPEINFKKD